eukprot:gene33441-67174_t
MHLNAQRAPARELGRRADLGRMRDHLGKLRLWADRRALLRIVTHGAAAFGALCHRYLNALHRHATNAKWERRPVLVKQMQLPVGTPRELQVGGAVPSEYAGFVCEEVVYAPGETPSSMKGTKKGRKGQRAMVEEEGSPIPPRNAGKEGTRKSTRKGGRHAAAGEVDHLFGQQQESGHGFGVEHDEEEEEEEGDDEGVDFPPLRTGREWSQLPRKE